MKKLDLSVKEANEYLQKKLGFKVLPVYYVRKLNTLHRIIEFIREKDPFVSLYRNRALKIRETSGHYFIDIWVRDELLTYRCKK